MKLPKPSLPTGKKNNAYSQAQQRASRRRDLLRMRPIRNPQLDWREEDGSIVLHIERKTNWKTRLIDIFVPLPDERTIVLDSIGTDVWLMIDGETTVEQIVQALAKKYQLSAREAEISLQQYLQNLGRRGYIGFTEASDDASEKGK